MLENKERASAWVQTLEDRGVTVTVRNNRLWLHPASAHAALSDDEVLTLRHCRQEIKSLVRGGACRAAAVRAPAVVEPATPTPDFRESPSEPRASVLEPCAYCGRSPCVGRSHHAYRALHANDPEQVSRRAEEAGVEMMAMLGLGVRY
jgi:hypothetical protein